MAYDEESQKEWNAGADLLYSPPAQFSTFLDRDDVTNYGWGTPTGGINSHDLGVSGQEAVNPFFEASKGLSLQADQSEDNAMNLLRQSLMASPEITPTQGIAAALLAAVPTFGGYLIGKGVGRPELPKGYFEAGGTTKALGDAYSTNPYQGGLDGAAIGAKAAQGYLGGLEANQKQKNDQLTKMAGIESTKAGRFDTKALSMQQAGMMADERAAAREDNQLFQKSQLDARNANAVANKWNPDVALAGDPEALAAYQRISTGKELPGDQEQLSPKALGQAILNKSKNTFADSSASRAAGENYILPTPQTKLAVTDATKVKLLGQKYISDVEKIAQRDPNWAQRTIESVLPQTEIGELRKSLDLFAVQVRNARESGVMTEPDFKRYSSYLTLGKLDTLGSLVSRMKELQTATDLSVLAALRTAHAGRENVKDYAVQFGISDEDLTRPIAKISGIATPAPGSKRLPGETQEQFIERRTKDHMAAGK